MTQKFRTALYYPQTLIDNPKWLRQAVLYWDEIGSIVPNKHVLNETLKKSYDMQILNERKLYKPFYPLEFFKNDKKFADNWMEDFENKSKQMQEINIHILPPKDAIYQFSYVDMNKNEVYEKVKHYIPPIGSREFLESKPYTDLLISTLAKHIANANTSSITIPYTDKAEYLHLAFPAVHNKTDLLAINLGLVNLLPTPTENVPLVDILNFKEKYQIELLTYRKELDEYLENLKKATNEKEISDLNIKFAENLHLQLLTLDKAFKDSRMSFFLGTLRNIFSAESTVITAITTYFASQPDANMPLLAAIGGSVLVASISVKEQYLEGRNRKSERLLQNSFSYLYLAEQEGIIDRP